MKVLRNVFESIANWLYAAQYRSIHLTRKKLAKSQKMPKSCNVAKVIPRLKLNNGMEMPVLGLGTWGSIAEQAEEAVKFALKNSYRLIDCAHLYENEKFVGKGIKSVLDEGTIKRKDLFITSKLWNTYHRPEVVEKAIRMSLNDLQLDYLDLYLMHWPMGYFEGPELFPRDSCNRIKVSHVDYIDTWKAMEKLIEKGLTKSIGVCNFNKAQLERVLQNAKITPVVNQFECHPLLTQTKLIEFCKSKNVNPMTYSPLGSPGRAWKKENEKTPMQIPLIIRLSNKYGKTPAQLLIRYQVQRGNIVIPKSVTPSRILSNMEVFDWKIEDHVMKAIDSLNENHRYVGLFRENGHHKYFPFCDEY